MIFIISKTLKENKIYFPSILYIPLSDIQR